jgi:hypothetical protein
MDNLMKGKQSVIAHPHVTSIAESSGNKPLLTKGSQRYQDTISSEEYS